MGAGQCKPGLRGMVEAPRFPSIRCVALRALRTQPALVMRILVTTIASHLRVFETRRAMAIFAGNAGMKPDQWEAGDIMVESDLLAPTRLFVALLATRP